MGQCVSRTLAATASASAPYAFERHYDAESCASSAYGHTWGGSESKSAKKKGSKTTKGVATSFGFRRRPASSSRADDNARERALDSNGNGGSTEDLFGGVDAVSGRSTPLARPRKEATGHPLRTNRFGFRGQQNSKSAKVGDVTFSAEPAFTTAHHKDSSVNNNSLGTKQSINAPYATPLIPTQVSYTGPATVIGTNGTTKTLTKQTVILTYQTQKYPAPQIYRRTADRPYENYGRSSSASRAYPEPERTRFTLHSNQLPKPQYPVKFVDTKSAKQVANNTRKVSGSSDGSREGSATDSGVSTYGDGSTCDSPRMRRRPRNLEMVMRGAHAFHLRELHVTDLDMMDDAVVTDTAVIPLPKLPSTFDEDQSLEFKPIYNVPTALQAKPIVPMRDITSTEDQSHSSMSTLDRYRTRSRTNRLSSEFKDEEKFVFDRAQPEILDKQNSVNTKNSSGVESPGLISSSKDSTPSCKSDLTTTDTWNAHAAGESMANRSQDDASLAFSISSYEDEKSKKDLVDDLKNIEVPRKTIVISEEAPVPHPLLMKSLTLSQNSDLKCMIGSMSSSNFSGLSISTATSTEPNNLPLTLENSKFDISALGGSTQSLIDDETSPADSLISSTSNSGSNNDLVNLERELGSLSSSAYVTANTKTKSNEVKAEDDADGDVPSPRSMGNGSGGGSKMMSPQSPGTPTHASGSLSLSDGRDFFDDEIADQPGLLFRKNSDGSPSKTTELEGKQLRKSRERIPNSPMQLKNRKLNNLRGTERTPSLDTLSSLASDDLMMDQDLARSITSLQSVDDYIERLDSSLRGLNSLDEKALKKELSGPMCAVSQWNQLLEQNTKLDRQLAAMAYTHVQRPSLSASTASLASIGASLPVRTARLLQRSRAHTPEVGEPPAAVQAPAPALLLQDVVDIKTLLLQLKRVLHEPGEELHSMSSETLDPLLLACESVRDNGQRPPTTAAPDLTQDLRRQILYLQGQLEERDRLVRVLQQQMSRLTEGQYDNAAAATSPEHTCNRATQTDRLRTITSTTLTNGENGGLVSWNEKLSGRKIYADAQKTKKPQVSTPVATKCTCGARKNNGYANSDTENGQNNKPEVTPKITTRIGSRYLQALANQVPLDGNHYVKRDLSINDRPLKKTSLYSSRSRSIENFQNQSLTVNEPLSKAVNIDEMKHHNSYGDLYHGIVERNKANERSRSCINRNEHRGEIVQNGYSTHNGDSFLNGKSPQNGQSTDTDNSSDGGYKSLPSSISGNGITSKKISGIPRRSVDNKLTRFTVKTSAI